MLQWISAAVRAVDVLGGVGARRRWSAAAWAALVRWHGRLWCGGAGAVGATAWWRDVALGSTTMWVEASAGRSYGGESDGLGMTAGRG